MPNKILLGLGRCLFDRFWRDSAVLAIMSKSWSVRSPCPLIGLAMAWSQKQLCSGLGVGPFWPCMAKFGHIGQTLTKCVRLMLNQKCSTKIYCMAIAEHPISTPCYVFWPLLETIWSFFDPDWCAFLKVLG